MKKFLNPHSIVRNFVQFRTSLILTSCLSLILFAVAKPSTLYALTTPGESSHMKDPPLDGELKRVQQHLDLLRKLREAGIDPAAYASAQAADQAGFELPKKVTKHLFQQSVLNAVRPYQDGRLTTDQALTIGSVKIPLSMISSGMVISGGTGSGKTTCILRIIHDLHLRRGIECTFWDPKGESRRFHLFWPKAMVFTPRTAPWQWLHPPAACDPLTYFIGVIAELRNEFELRSETFPLAYSIWERILRGLKPTDPFPSWSDFRRVLEYEAARQKRENLYTLARAFQSVETVMGENARVRLAADISGRYPVKAYDLVGLDPALIRFFLGLHFNRLLHEAQQHEHTTGLKCLEIIDEAGPIGSVELALRTSGTLSSVKRFATMSRFTGTGLILGVQNIHQLDPFLKNAPTIVCFRTPSVDDAIDAAKMLGLPRDSTEELMRLGVGECWIRCAGWPRPVKTRTEAFEP